MRRSPGPSLLSLARRGLVSLVLIVRGAVLLLRASLRNRGWLRARDGALECAQARFARDFVSAAMRFRGGLIKLGQVASLRVDVLPEGVTRELVRLQDRVEPHPFAVIAARVEAELHDSLDALFAEFGREPIAAASLGQVHRARARDGRCLAVKVLYPGIQRSVAVDLAMARLALWLFDWFTVVELGQVYGELRSSLHGEMDYLREGRAAEEIGENMARDPQLAAHVRVPLVHWDLTTRSVLAMEFVEGVKINEVESEGSASRDDLVLWASRAFLHMIFRDGFFHCDPHPGNLLIEPDGRIAIIDFGMNVRIAPALLEAARSNARALVSRDARLYAESLVEAGIVERADLPVVMEIAEMHFDPAYYNLTPQEAVSLDLGAYVLRLRVHLKKLRSFRLPDGVVMGFRATSLLYGLIVELAPGLRPLDLLGPYVMRFLAGDEPASTLAGSSGDSLGSQSDTPTVPDGGGR